MTQILKMLEIRLASFENQPNELIENSDQMKLSGYIEQGMKSERKESIPSQLNINSSQHIDQINSEQIINIATKSPET